MTMLGVTAATLLVIAQAPAADALPPVHDIAAAEPQVAQSPAPEATPAPETAPVPETPPAPPPPGAEPFAATAAPAAGATARREDATPAAGTQPADIVVTAADPANAPDPLRGVNETAFNATQSVDRALVGPVARGYKKGVPKPVRDGIHNFLYNLREPIVFVNFVLQLKIGKAVETAARFGINSTVGAAGLIDIAKRKPFRMPRRGNGFANTLGYYGIKPGPFMFLPIVGPTTVRDLLGGTIDRLVLPVAVGDPFNRTAYTIPAGVLGAVDHRAEFDETLKALHDGAADPYANSRTFYLQRRQAEIDALRGRGIGASSPMGVKPTGRIDSKGRERGPLRPPAEQAPAEPIVEEPIAAPPASDTVPATALPAADAAPSPMPTPAEPAPPLPH